MTRPLRIEYPDAVYHVMNRGLARQKVFLRREDYQNFLKLLEELHLRWNAQVFAYALMGNHYHLCLQTPLGNLSRIMRHLDGIYTQRFNRTHRRDGALFRGRYKAIVIEAEEYLGEVVRYIHLNPVKAGLVKDPRDYAWSSHQEYMSRKRSWLSKQRLLESMGGPRGFHEYVMEGNDGGIEQFYKASKQKPVLGTEEFIEQMKEKVGELHNEVTREEKRAFRPDLEHVLKQIEEEYGIRREDISKGKRGRESKVRQLAIYLAHERCGMNQTEVARRFGVTSYKTVSWHCAKARERIAGDKKFSEHVKALATLNIRQLEI